MGLMAHSILVFSAIFAAAKYTVVARIYYNRKSGEKKQVLSRSTLAIGINTVSLILIALAWAHEENGQREQYFEMATYIALYGIVLSVYAYNSTTEVHSRDLYGAMAPGILILAQYSATLWTTSQGPVGTILTALAAVFAAASVVWYSQTEVAL